MGKLDKSLIKLCPYCQKFYYANKPHFLKTSECNALEKMMEEFRKTNDILPYEVWHITYRNDDGMFIPQYDHEATQKNFMKMVYQEMLKLNKE
jgi:hypothetical protein